MRYNNLGQQAYIKQLDKLFVFNKEIIFNVFKQWILPVTLFI